MVKEEKVYTTSDGKQYKTRKSAERNENVLTMENAGYSKEEVDKALLSLAENNKNIEIVLEGGKDWRNLPNHLVKQFPKLIKDLEEDVVTYQLIKETGGYFSRSEDVVEQVKVPRLKDGDYPYKFAEHAYELTEQVKEETGSTFKVEPYEESDRLIKFKVVEHKLTPEEKMAKGYELSSHDIETLLWEREEVYEASGEDGRWSRSMTTVVKGDDDNLYAIHWEKGLTENQEDEFWQQPQRVKLEEQEVVTTTTEIVYLDTEDTK